MSEHVRSDQDSKNVAPYEPAADIRPSMWLRDALVGFASSVVSIVPAGYVGYARLLHPAYRRSNSHSQKVGWHDIASLGGIVVDKESQWERIAELLPPAIRNSYEPPLEGTLDQETYRELISLLKGHTDTPSMCWYGVWNGYEYIQPEYKRAPLFQLPGRSYHLLQGTLSALSFCKGPFFQSANLFWPDDRRWCVASEVDFRSTYIAAASEEVLDELLTTFRGELFRVMPEDCVNNAH